MSWPPSCISEFHSSFELREDAGSDMFDIYLKFFCNLLVCLEIVLYFIFVHKSAFFFIFWTETERFSLKYLFGEKDLSDENWNIFNVPGLLRASLFYLLLKSTSITTRFITSVNIWRLKSVCNFDGICISDGAPICISSKQNWTVVYVKLGSDYDIITVLRQQDYKEFHHYPRAVYFPL